MTAQKSFVGVEDFCIRCIFVGDHQNVLSCSDDDVAVGEGVGVAGVAAEFLIGEAAQQEAGGTVAPVPVAGSLALAQFDGVDVLVRNGQGRVEGGIHRQGVFAELEGDGAGEHDHHQHGGSAQRE